MRSKLVKIKRSILVNFILTLSLSKTSSYQITNLGRDFLKGIASIENDN